VNAKKNNNFVFIYFLYNIEMGEFMAEDKSALELKRVVFINGNIDEKLAETAIKEILSLESKNQSAPIIMLISSYGGSYDPAMSIINTMNLCKSPVYTVCLRHAQSAGSLILLSGEKGHRYCVNRSRIMIHQLSGFSSGAVEQMVTTIDHIKELHKEMCEVIYENTKIKKTVLMKNLQGSDWHLTEKEAIQYGVVDKVIKSFSEIDVINW